MNLELIPVPLRDKPILDAVMQRYFSESSAFTGDRPDADGRFPYYYFDLYWTEDGRFPFLIRVDGAIAGLALVRTLAGGRDPLYQMAEFFILYTYRQRGIGRAAAVALFDRFPGRWEVAQHAGNAPGIAFWRRVIGDYTGGRFTETWRLDDGQEGPVQTFRSGPAASDDV